MFTSLGQYVLFSPLSPACFAWTREKMLSRNAPNVAAVRTRMGSYHYLGAVDMKWKSHIMCSIFLCF